VPKSNLINGMNKFLLQTNIFSRNQEVVYFIFVDFHVGESKVCLIVSNNMFFVKYPLYRP
jgi:hypothetical protein